MSARRLAAIGVLCLLSGFGSATAQGSVAKPSWTITSVAEPTNFVPGDSSGKDLYVVTLTNTGGAASEGVVSITDTLPTGLSLDAAGVSGVDRSSGEAMECANSPELRCEYTATVAAGDALVVKIPVDIAPDAPRTVTNVAAGGGGGGPETTMSVATTVSPTPAGFGIAPGSLLAGLSAAQAGAHADLTTAFALNEGSLKFPASRLKDLGFDLPPGLIGGAAGLPQCNAKDVLVNACPEEAAVGVVHYTVDFAFGTLLLARPFTALVYNIRPYSDEPAAFAFVASGIVPVRLDTSVVMGEGGYHVHVAVHDTVELLTLASTAVTFWGVPADHNGPGPYSAEEASPPGGERHVVTYGGRGSAQRTPFLTNPVTCAGGPLTVALSVNSWSKPGEDVHASTSLPAPSGCELLSFQPSIAVSPESLRAGAPTGYGVDVRVPQSQTPDGLGTPELKDTTVTLPLGTVLNPSAARGLEACTAAEIGIGSPGQPSCPDGSDIGTVTVTTPLLDSPLQGHVYLGAPSNQGGGESIPLYLVVQESGVLLKLAGTATTDPNTGQITTVFKEDPQFPFSDLHLQIEGGPRAPLINPQACGAALSTSDLAPWSSPFTADATPSSAFEVSYDGNGAPCPASPPFAPSFGAGTISNQAGSYSPFTMTLVRGDQDQTLARVAVHTPPGLLGMLSQVPLCGEPQASAGSCSAASQIGSTTVGAGVGPEPFYESGRVYLTGPYHGSPFGLSIVVPTKAGPFDLGDVVVRATINVDPHTGALTIASDPVPSMRQGIPLALRTVNLIVDRAGFVFNPTSCNPLVVAGTITANQGASVNVSSRFQAANCAALAFRPHFTASTRGVARRNGKGASLRVKLTTHEGPQSVPSAIGEATFRRTEVELPKTLPSRLTTLQRACTAAQFASSPAGCPAASFVGTALLRTPILAKPLAGPAILVSHGGAQFPDLVVVLQGEGITVDLTGDTLIRGARTFSKFDSLPDAPFSSFELNLPEGPHSVLGSPGGNLCGKRLTMATTMEGQNGAAVKQETKIAVTGCSKRAHHKAAARPGKVKH